MKIMLGLDNLDTPEDITAFIKEGADEFFAGFVPPKWYNQYGWEVSLNRRENGKEYQFVEYHDLKKIVNVIHEQEKKIFITLNAHQYVEEQVPFIKKIVERIEKFNPDGYIVADPALMILLREWNIKRPLHLSTGATCFNSEVIHYFNQIADISRVIIPRKMSLKEMEILVKNCQDLEVEFETMIIHYRCFFNDGYCLNWHSGGCDSLCNYFLYTPKYVKRLFPATWKKSLQRILEKPQSQFKEDSNLNKFLNSISLSIREKHPVIKKDKNLEDEEGLHFSLASEIFKNCGLCAIMQLKEIGVSTLKIPARGVPITKRKYISIVRQVIEHPNPTKEFCQSLINSPRFCSTLGSCYYYV